MENSKWRPGIHRPIGTGVPWLGVLMVQGQHPARKRTSISQSPLLQGTAAPLNGSYRVIH